MFTSKVLYKDGRRDAKEGSNDTTSRDRANLKCSSDHFRNKKMPATSSSKLASSCSSLNYDNSREQPSSRKPIEVQSSSFINLLEKLMQEGANRANGKTDLDRSADKGNKSVSPRKKKNKSVQQQQKRKSASSSTSRNDASLSSMPELVDCDDDDENACGGGENDDEENDLLDCSQHSEPTSPSSTKSKNKPGKTPSLSGSKSTAPSSTLTKTPSKKKKKPLSTSDFVAAGERNDDLESSPYGIAGRARSSSNKPWNVDLESSPHGVAGHSRGSSNKPFEKSQSMSVLSSPSPSSTLAKSPLKRKMKATTAEAATSLADADVHHEGSGRHDYKNSSCTDMDQRSHHSASSHSSRKKKKTYERSMSSPRLSDSPTKSPSGKKTTRISTSNKSVGSLRESEPELSASRSRSASSPERPSSTGVSAIVLDPLSPPMPVEDLSNSTSIQSNDKKTSSRSRKSSSSSSTGVEEKKEASDDDCAIVVKKNGGGQTTMHATSTPSFSLPLNSMKENSADDENVDESSKFLSQLGANDATDVERMKNINQQYYSGDDDGHCGMDTSTNMGISTNAAAAAGYASAGAEDVAREEEIPTDTMPLNKTISTACTIELDSSTSTDGYFSESEDHGVLLPPFSSMSMGIDDSEGDDSGRGNMPHTYQTRGLYLADSEVEEEEESVSEFLASFSSLGGLPLSSGMASSCKTLCNDMSESESSGDMFRKEEDADGDEYTGGNDNETGDEKNIVRAQSVVRAWLSHRLTRQRVEAIVCIQSTARRYLAEQKVSVLYKRKLEEVAVVKVQCYIRCMAAVKRKDLLVTAKEAKHQARMLQAATKIQSLVRDVLFREQLAWRAYAASIIQGLARGVRVREEVATMIYAATKIGGLVRGVIARKHHSQMVENAAKDRSREYAATKIEGLVRGFIARKHHSQRVENAAKIRSSYLQAPSPKMDFSAAHEIPTAVYDDVDDEDNQSLELDEAMLIDIHDNDGSHDASHYFLTEENEHQPLRIGGGSLQQELAQLKPMRESPVRRVDHNASSSSLAFSTDGDNHVSIASLAVSMQSLDGEQLVMSDDEMSAEEDTGFLSKGGDFMESFLLEDKSECASPVPLHEVERETPRDVGNDDVDEEEVAQLNQLARGIAKARGKEGEEEEWDAVSRDSLSEDEEEPLSESKSEETPPAPESSLSEENNDDSAESKQHIDLVQAVVADSSGHHMTVLASMEQKRRLWSISELHTIQAQWECHHRMLKSMSKESARVEALLDSGHRSLVLYSRSLSAICTDSFLDKKGNVVTGFWQQSLLAVQRKHTAQTTAQVDVVDGYPAILHPFIDAFSSFAARLENHLPFLGKCTEELARLSKAIDYRVTVLEEKYLDILMDLKQSENKVAHKWGKSLYTLPVKA
jgi:nucleolin